MLSRISVSSLLLAFALAAPAYGQAQIGTGAISGVVTDSSDAAIPGALVTVTNTDTGVKRNATTTSAGQFTVPVLPPGPYLTHVELDGFTNAEAKDLVVTVGSAVTLRLKMHPAGVAETVIVTANAVEVDASKTDQSTLIDRRQINDLPINGRRADQFALLVPGVARDGRFGLLSYRGQSGVFNNFTVEGNDDNQAYFAEARGRTRIASNISANAIREFQVAQSGFLPEYGRSAGGGINAVVRSGTNRWAPDAFYYFRNNHFNAKDPFATINPPEKRQQFGGSLGGPVIRNRVFMFFNTDIQRRNAPLLIEDLSHVLENGLPANPTPADQLAFATGVAELTKQFPEGGPGHSQSRTFNQSLWLGKVDAVLNHSNQLSITHNYLNAHGERAIQTPLVLGNVGRNGTDDVRLQSFNVRLTTTSGRWVNELRTQLSRDFEYEFGDQPPPQVFVGNFSFGRADFLERPALPDERKLQFVDNWTYLVGRHAFKVGTDLVRTNDIIDNPANFGGSYSYSNALTFGRDLLNPAGHNYSSYAQKFGLPGVTFHTVDAAFFVQDQWRPMSRLTINYGVRYDYRLNPDPIAPNPDIPETTSINSAGGIGPRLGMAYDLRGDGRTVARLAYGVYYGRTSNGLIQNALVQTGVLDLTKNTVGLTARSTDSFAPNYPNVLSAFPAAAVGSTSSFRLDPGFQPPRMRDFNVGIERQIAPLLTVAVSYIHTHGDRLPASIDTNLPEPTFERTYVFPDGSTVTLPFAAGVTRTASGEARNLNLSRPNPNFGSIARTSSVGHTWYNAMFLELRRRFAKNYQFGVSYTLAKAENTGGSANGSGAGAESPFGGGTAENQFDLEESRGIAPTDQRHKFVVNGIANLRYGFRVSGIFVAEGGRPYSDGVSVGNLPFATADGTQYNGFGGLRGLGGGGDRNVAPNTTRNSTYGDANYRVDMRIARDFRIKRAVFEVLAEGFNIINRNNYNGFQSTRYDAQPTTATTPVSQPVTLTARTDFGTPTADGSQPDGTNARRFQIALRFRY